MSSNLSRSVCPEIGKDMLDSQDQELFSILEELQISDHILPLERSVNISATRIAGYFCPDTVFNLSNRVLTDLEVKVLKKGLDFALIQRKINEPELRQDCAQNCFSEINLHHSLVRFPLFPLSPLGNLQEVIPTWRYF